MRRKHRRKYRVPLDDTGVAIGCLFADSRAVDQGNTEPAFCEMQRHRCADNAGTENHCISTCHTRLQATFSLYMDCCRRQRYKTSILTAPEFPQMKSISALAAALTLCGRHGTLIAAASIFIGLAVPPLAAAFRPHFGEAIVVMLTLAFLRVDPVELRRHWKQPGLIAAATIWTLLVFPAVLGTLFLAFKLDQKMHGLYFMLVLQMSAPGLMSSPALAALLGLDVALTLATLIAATAITPFTASLFTYVFLGTALASPLEFGLRLFLIIAGCALAAGVIRVIAGRRFIEAQREAIDGLSVIAMSMFAIAAMDGAMDHFRADPILVVKLTALAFLLALTSIAGNRNVGLMLAATGFAIPDIAWLYFTVAQFPIYLLPPLLKPI